MREVVFDIVVLNLVNRMENSVAFKQQLVNMLQEQLPCQKTGDMSDTLPYSFRVHYEATKGTTQKVLAEASMLKECLKTIKEHDMLFEANWELERDAAEDELQRASSKAFDEIEEVFGKNGTWKKAIKSVDKGLKAFAKVMVEDTDEVKA